jgi:hypothetical protein
LVNVEPPGLPLEITSAQAVDITAMLQQLQWQSLQSRRAYAQTVMMYRIVYNLVDIPAEHHLNRTSLPHFQVVGSRGVWFIGRMISCTL